MVFLLGNDHRWRSLHAFRWWWMARMESLWPFYESVFPEEEEMQYAMPQGSILLLRQRCEFLKEEKKEIFEVTLLSCISSQSHFPRWSIIMEQLCDQVNWKIGDNYCVSKAKKKKTLLLRRGNWNMTHWFATEREEMMVKITCEGGAMLFNVISLRSNMTRTCDVFYVGISDTINQRIRLHSIWSKLKTATVYDSFQQRMPFKKYSKYCRPLWSFHSGVVKFKGDTRRGQRMWIIMRGWMTSQGLGEGEWTANSAGAAI